MLERVNEQLEYEKISPEEMQSRGILGRLYGPVADTVHATRNNRFYSDAVWESVFDNPMMKEKFERGGVFGECGHPEGRDYVDMEKIALCMPKPPKKDKTGKLKAIFDILNTPCGKILKTLCDYGYKIGISSRGQGDTYIDEEGNESVDPATYNCECFDAVLIPAVKEATLSMVESFDTNKANLKKALCEALDTSSVDDRKVMEDTLKDLHIDYTENGDSIDEVSKDTEVDDDKSEETDELQEALTQNRKLEKEVIALQEKLSACYAREIDTSAQIEKYKTTIGKLTASAQKSRVLAEKLQTVNESLDSKEKESIKKDDRIKELQRKIHSLEEQMSKNDVIRSNQTRRLSEDVSKKENEIKTLNESIKVLNKTIETNSKDAEREKNKLIESIEELKADSQIKNAEYSKKLKRANSLIEEYKKVATTAVDKYIASQALRLGVKAEEIKNKLSENFSFSDIDKACESLQEYRINFGRLPFDVSKQKKVSMQITESKDPIKKTSGFDDELDDQLLSLIKHK